MRIMVVDDEPLIGQYILQCIRKADPDAEIIGAVTSGTKALRKLSETAADLVFADITMPKMDGIELLREIKKRHPATEIIMLTCHDDFSYARAAIQNQARNYILKSEVSVELIRSLLEELKNSRKEQIEARAASHISQNNYLRQLVEKDGAAEEITAEELRENQIYLENRAFLALYFHNDETNLKSLRACLTDGFENPLFYAHNDKEMFLLLNLRRDCSYQKNEHITAYFRTREQELNGTIGCSLVHHHLEKLQTAIHEAICDKDMRFYQVKGGSFAHESGVGQIEQYIMRATVKIQDRDISGGCLEIEKLLEYAEEKHPQVAFLKDSVIQMLSGLQEKLGLDLGQAGLQLESSRTFETFEACVIECLGALRGLGKLYSAPIRKALDYIGFHYAEDISLNTVADFVYLNRDYLSRQFKKEVGINFSEYLLALRLKRAKQLLETTNMRISDVALSVGMTNMSYFSTVFHKSFGYTPNEIRKK